MVVMASFVIHMIADGCAFSFGVLYVELLDYFQESRSKTAWAGSVAVSMPLITGPIASALTTRFGCRRTTIVGAIIASFGFVTSAFAPNIEVLCLTFGVIAGFGLSMVYVPAVIIVAFYFHKKRAFATGVAVAGSGIGTFIFAPLTEALIERYTWRGALVVIGGIMLNIVVCGALFRPLETTIGKKSHKKTPSSISESEVSSTQVAESEDTAMFDTSLGLDSMTHSLINIPTSMSQREFPVSVSSRKDKPDLLNDSSIGLTDPLCAIRSASSVWPRQKIPKTRIDDQFLPMYRKDIFYRGSLSMDQYHTSCVLHSGLTTSCPNILVPASTTAIDSHDEHSSSLRFRFLRISSKARGILEEMLDITLLTDVLFVYFCLSSMILYMWYDVPYVYITDKATHTMDIPYGRSSFLISIIGITSTFGQVIVGYIGDLPKVNALILYNVLTSIAGISTMFVALFNSYISLAIYCASFGFFISGNYALTTIILVDLLGMEHLTNAYGLVMLSEGLANLFGPSIAGGYMIYITVLTASMLSFYSAI